MSLWLKADRADTIASPSWLSSVPPCHTEADCDIDGDQLLQMGNIAFPGLRGVAFLEHAALRQIFHQCADAEAPRRGLIAGGDAVVKAAQ